MDLSIITSVLAALDPVVAGALALTSLLAVFLYKVLNQFIRFRTVVPNYMEENKLLYDATVNELLEMRKELRSCMEQQSKLLVENRKLQYKMDLTITELYRWTQDYPPKHSNIQKLYDLVKDRHS